MNGWFNEFGHALCKNKVGLSKMNFSSDLVSKLMDQPNIAELLIFILSLK